MIQYTIVELQHSLEYERFLIAYSMLPSSHFVDDLPSKLFFFKQRTKFSKEPDVLNSKVFTTTIGSVTLDSGSVVTNKHANSNSKGKNNGCNHFNKRDKGHSNKN